jgi:hypothetical protein
MKINLCMNMKKDICKWRLLLSFALVYSSRLVAEGIPEPSLILYGTLKNIPPGNERITTGKLTWIFRAANGQTVTIEGVVTNVLNQFSYVLEVPCEQSLGLATTNTVSLSPTPATFDRSQVTYQATLADQGTPAIFVTSTQENIALSIQDRGCTERVDLLVKVTLADNDKNGLPDDWEWKYFGYMGVDLNADPDHDGMSNRAEYVAGTDPKDTDSVFQFLSYQRVSSGGILVQWQSVEGRFYSLLRYPSLLSTNYTIVKQSIMATPPVNTLQDREVTPTGAFFYRLQIEP